MRTCVVLQPGYLPWLGFFEQMRRADEFVLLDDVQFDRHGWRNRNRIKGPEGPLWLTVPVRVVGPAPPLIRDAMIDATQGRWMQKHLRSLRMHYGRCPHFDWLYPKLEALLTRAWTRIADLDVALIRVLCEKLGIRTSIRSSSGLDVCAERSGRLVSICRALGCDHYYSGAAARGYLDVNCFREAGIAVEFQDYTHPSYAQRYGAFVSHLSVVDLMFNCGPDSLGVILEGAGSGCAVAGRS